MSKGQNYFKNLFSLGPRTMYFVDVLGWHKQHWLNAGPATPHLHTLVLPELITVILFNACVYTIRPAAGFKSVAKESRIVYF